MYAPRDNSEGTQADQTPEIETFVQSLNDAWLDGNYDELYQYFAEGCVLLPPTGNEPVVGAEQIIDSYRQFGEVGTIHDFTIENIQTFTQSSVAVSHVSFEVDYEVGERRYLERGLDIYVISVIDGHFQVVWRAQKTLD